VISASRWWNPRADDGVGSLRDRPLPQLTASAGVAPESRPGVWTRVGVFEEVIVTFLVEAEHFLDLRLRFAA